LVRVYRVFHDKIMTKSKGNIITTNQSLISYETSNYYFKCYYEKLPIY